MGKLKLDLLKGIEEQEKAIETESLKETLEEQIQVEQQQTEIAKKCQSARKNLQTDKMDKRKTNKQTVSAISNKSTNKIINSISEKQPEETGDFANEITVDVPQEKNSKKKFINFDITDIDRYLTAVAGIYGKSKTKYLHDLVVADMKVHPEIETLIKNL